MSVQPELAGPVCDDSIQSEDSSFPPFEDRLLPAKDVATRLDIPVSFIQRETKEHRLPCLHFGRRKRYSVNAVRQHLLKRAYSDNLE